VQAYAAHTGTKRNLAALHGAGWGLLLSPGKPCDPRFKYALDNGAFGAWQQGKPFNVPAFERHVSRHGSGAEFVVAPDIVAGGAASLAFTMEWLPRLQGVGKRRLIAVQDGMTEEHVRPHLCETVGIFVGGTTEWKLQTLPLWGRVARQTGAYLHVGRVNTVRRIRLCHEAGAHSIDGTSATRFSCTLPMLDAAVRQSSLFLAGG
jgi:hypothetical protein